MAGTSTGGMVYRCEFRAHAIPRIPRSVQHRYRVIPLTSRVKRRDDVKSHVQVNHNLSSTSRTVYGDEIWRTRAGRRVKEGEREGVR